MVVNLALRAGRLAERRGWTSVDLVDPDVLTCVTEEVRAWSGQVRWAAENPATTSRVLEAMANVGE